MYYRYQSNIFSFTIDIDVPKILVPNNFPPFGENITLSCTTLANPPVVDENWSWKHNGVGVGVGSQLSLYGLSPSDSGVYECFAASIVGITSNTTSITILCE